MNYWDIYESRISVNGISKRDIAIQREKKHIRNKAVNSPSFHNVLIDSNPQGLTILDTSSMNIKTICALPDEKLVSGSIVEWMGYYWLVTMCEASSEVYARATMIQCNHLLKWLSDDGRILSRWCVVDSGSSYSSGESVGSDNIISLGDIGIYMTISKDIDTLKFNRTNRFIIDDSQSSNPLAYRIVKPFKLGGGFDQNGVLYYSLEECNTEDTDNLDLRIANYYHKPITPPSNIQPTEIQYEDKKRWF